MSESEAAYVGRQRRALADLMWEPDIGDRHTSMTVLVCGARPDEIEAALHGALLNDEEMAAPREWAGYADPFGDWHEDPCDDSAPTELSTPSANSEITPPALKPPALTPRRRAMKPGIHPDYRPVVFQDATTGEWFLTRSNGDVGADR